MDQRSFDFSADERPVCRRRKAGRRAQTRRRQAVANLPLTESPVLQRCGLCGLQQTVLGETAVCPGCGGIIVRQDSSEAEGWVQPLDELLRDEEQEQGGE
ncbi:MAG: hypothetical protein HPY69_06685 [Armatimonadetes bacterium]|nr:hypothetical protein [Armatimonadota bacterium]